MEERVIAVYWLETPRPLEEAAESIAGEQSTGTFIAVPGETDELRARFRARIEQLEPLGEVDRPSLPGARSADGGPYHQGRLALSFPVENFGSNLPTLMSTVMGNLYELRQLSGLKLVELHLPATLISTFPGPQFGIEGTRRLAGVPERPLIGTIIKPSVGLNPAQTASLAGELADAGIDFIKDDELMADPPHSPLEQRVAAVMRELQSAADRNGRLVMYAFNISDSWENMLRHHDTVAQHGGSCVMVSINSVGLAAVQGLRCRCHLPIHGHRNGWGMLTRHPALGITFPAYQVFWRLAGTDHLHVNGLDNKFWEPDDSVVQSIAACLQPMASALPVMPVVSSGQWGGQAPETYRRCQTVDLIYLAGGGIMAHPQGPAAGCQAIRQAWEAAVGGIDLETYATTHQPLKESLMKFGGAP